MGNERKEQNIPFEPEQPIRYGLVVTDLEFNYMIEAAKEIDGLAIGVTEKPGDFYRDIPEDADPDKASEIQTQIVPEGYLRLTITAPSINAYIAHGLKYLELCGRYVQGARMVEDLIAEN